jgi:uncharacterized protein
VEPRVVDNPEAERYELRLDERLVGELRYTRDDDGKLVLVHTEVDPSLKGQGLGDVFVQGVLDDLRERGIEYRVICPFVAAYLRRHPQQS